MNIGIIGAGKIGSTVAKLLANHGYSVAISNSRGPETLTELVNELGPNVQATSFQDAAKFGEIVFVAVPLKSYTSLPADSLSGKIVIDANNYYPDRDGHIPELDSDETTSSELIANHLPGAKIVKAFNTIYFKHLAMPSQLSVPIDDRRAIFVAGDDPAAKQAVSDLIEKIGFGAVDTGSLEKGGRLQQPNSPLYNQEISVKDAKAEIANYRSG